MAIDIYGKQRELQDKYNQQQKRLSDAQAQFDQAKSSYKPDPMKQNAFGAGWQPTPNNDAYQKAEGAYRAEKHAADIELANLKPQMEAEEQRVGAIKPLAELQEKQEMRAKEFRQAFPSILDSKLGQARTESRRKIAEGVNNARANYNQRGLLYSGLRSGAEADVAANAENELADTAVKTNQELMDTGNQLDQDAIDTGLQIGNVSQNLQNTDSTYRQSIIDQLINRDTARQQALGGLLGTGAQLAGVGVGALGSSKKSQQG